MGANNVKGRLDNWLLIPFEGGQAVIGLYSGDAYPEGHHIRTSKVSEIRDGKAYTRNSVYELGKKAPDGYRFGIAFNTDFLFAGGDLVARSRA